jgi:DNA-binding transcriptional LysR family regulator
VADDGVRRSPARSPTRETLRITPAFTTNDGSVAGSGRNRAWAWCCAPNGTRPRGGRGTLVRVLADWQFDSAPITLLVPTRKGRTARVQALLQCFEDSYGDGTRRDSADQNITDRKDKDKGKHHGKSHPGNKG